MPTSKIMVKNLKKDFGELEVLKDISVEIDEGEVVVVIGPSGSGKSTFLRCLNRLESISGGHVIVDGNDITDKKVNINSVRENVGMVFQQPTPFRKSIRDNILFAPKRHGLVAGKEAADGLVEGSLRAAALWDEVKDKLDKSAYALSGGQQ